MPGMLPNAMPQTGQNTAGRGCNFRATATQQKAPAAEATEAQQNETTEIHMKKKMNTVKPDAQCRPGDPLPKNWSKLFRKVTRGEIRAGDILDFGGPPSGVSWAGGLIGCDANPIITYRRAKGGAK